MVDTGDRISTTLVAIATLNGRAYYRITSLLKEVGFSFKSLIPGSEVPKGVSVVLTTQSERERISNASVITLEEVDDSISLRHEIAKKVQKRGNANLIIGIDPGSRIGVAAFYGGEEIFSSAISSPDDVVSRVRRLQELTKKSSREQVVRIGNGDLGLAIAIMKSLKYGKNPPTRIEIVDETGTSSNVVSKPNRRGARDRRAAAIIAFREGSQVS